MIYVKDTRLTTWLLFGAINMPVGWSHKSSASSFHVEGISWRLSAVCVILYKAQTLSDVSDIITVFLLQCIREPLFKACLLYVFWISIFLGLLQFYSYAIRIYAAVWGKKHIW